MIDDVGKTIKAILYDRIVSPLFGTFLLSWCGWNWRLIILFLTDESTTVEKKFEYVDTELYPGDWEMLSHGLLWPLLTTIFFLYLYPWIARFVYGHWREEQNRLKSLQIEKDGETPLKEEEAREIKSQALQAEFRYQEEREKREARIRELETLVKSLQRSEVPTASNENEVQRPQKTKVSIRPSKTYSKNVKEGMLSILRLLESIAPGKGVKENIFMDHVKKDEELSKLESSFLLHCLDNLFESHYVLNGGGSFYVQPKGRSVLINKNFDE